MTSTTATSTSLDSTPSAARPPKRLGKRLAAMSLGAVAAASFAVVSPADAAVVSSTGAAVTTEGACNGRGSIAFSQTNYGFDYQRSIMYVHGRGWGSWSGWTAMDQGTAAAGVNVGSRGVYVAMYVQYADWNGYQWEYGGEWVTFNGSYWCYV